MKLHLFDFDGTISESDSMFDFLKFIHSKLNFYYLLFICFPLFIRFSFNLISRNKFKENFLKIFLNNCSKEYLNKKAKEFSLLYMDKIKKNAFEYIIDLKKDKNNVISIVTASLDIWIKPISKELDVSFISTKSKYKKNYFVSFNGENCWGKEKVLRIKGN